MKIDSMKDDGYQKSSDYPKVSSVPSEDEISKILYTFRSEDFGEVFDLIYNQDFSDMVPTDIDVEVISDGSYHTVETDLGSGETLEDYQDEFEDLRRKAEQVGDNLDKIRRYLAENLDYE